MPRTSAVECPGCPPIRALTFDGLGLIKVVEARGKEGIPKVIERWGEPDSSRCVLAASIDDQKADPLVAIARKNGLIEVLNPLNGDLRISIAKSGDAGHLPENDNMIGLHLFRRKRLELSSRYFTFLFESKKVKGVEINLWDLDKCSKIWNAKSPPKNSLGIFNPTWFTSATFLHKDDHRKIVAGTNNHQVRLYDISAQRRPIISFDFRESPIKVVTEDLDGYTIYVGTGSGDLASVDMRTGTSSLLICESLAFVCHFVSRL
ncbi:hypothetical protein HHK36_030389 [Tetracentron sinense]|uniref:Uncharacterized protein n=1 Tax=Tetracentron sinense TaxID=13715 RepID=A0A835CY86_TETSI|nr:hypothetical protein HHK36_030389 [Tetracentron sinense]